MAAPSPLMAWLWKNEELSDVTVQLCTTQKAKPQQRSGKAKAARRGKGGSAAHTAGGDGPEELEEFARSYPCHANILASCSPSYFRARVTRGGSSSGGGSGGSSGVLAYASSHTAGTPGPATPRSLLLQEHVEEGELDAMEAVLRSCYTGQLCDEGADAAQLSVAALLQMVVLSDRFDVSTSLSTCGDELNKRKAGDYSLADVDRVLGGLPPGFQSHPAHSQVVAAATRRLLRLLGNAEAVCGAWYDADSSLDTQLLHLTLPSLLALLGSDQLTARSEGSVLMMADAWVMGPRGLACSKAQLRQVAEVVRLGQLRPTFTFSVLQHLPWLQLSSDERESLVHFSVAGMEGGAATQSLLLQLSGPAAWYDAKARAAWKGPTAAVADWGMPKEDLTKALDGVCNGHAEVTGSFVFFSGYSVAPVLQVIGEAESQQAWVGHTVRVLRGGSVASSVACKLLLSTAKFEIPGKVGSKTWKGGFPSSYISQGLQLKLAAGSAVLDVAAWAPLLVQGKLHVQCTITACG